MAKRKTAKVTSVTEATIKRAVQTLHTAGINLENAVLRVVLEIAEAIRTELYKDEKGNNRSMKWIQSNIVPGHVDGWNDDSLMRCIKGAVGFAAGWRYTFDQFLKIDGLKPRMFHVCRSFTHDDAKWNDQGRPKKAEVTKWLTGKFGHQSEDVQERMGKKKAQTKTTSTDTTDDAPTNPLVSLGNGISAVRNDKKGLVDGQALKTNAFALVALMDEATQIEFYEELRGYKSIVAERERRAKEAQKQTRQTPKAKATSTKRKPARRKPAKRSRKVASK